MAESEKPPSPSSDRRQWQRIFNSLVELVQSQQSQVESLVDDRKFLEDYIRIQQSFWESHAGLLESQISQMKKEEEMGRRVFASKFKLNEWMKEREALLYKKQLEIAESDLVDFRACMESVSAKISEEKERLKCGEADKGKIGADDDLKEQERRIAALEKEIRKWKHDYRKLSAKKESEISALVAEKDFVWNQFKKADDDYANLLRTKRTEVEQANEAIEILRHNLEKLQSVANEKDDTIAILEAGRARLQLGIRKWTQEAEQTKEKLEKLLLNEQELLSLAKKKDEMIAKLRSDLVRSEMNLVKCTNETSRASKDLDSPRYSRNAWAIPSGSRPRRGSVQSSLESSKDNSSRKRKRVNPNSSGSRASGTVHGLGRCSGVLQERTGSPPRLFSAKLKVPKVKSLPSATA